MKKVIVEEILKSCSLEERILVKLFPKTFVKIYNIARIHTINNM